MGVRHDCRLDLVDKVAYINPQLYATADGTTLVYTSLGPENTRTNISSSDYFTGSGDNEILKSQPPVLGETILTWFDGLEIQSAYQTDMLSVGRSFLTPLYFVGGDTAVAWPGVTFLQGDPVPTSMTGPIGITKDQRKALGALNLPIPKTASFATIGTYGPQRAACYLPGYSNGFYMLVQNYESGTIAASDTWDVYGKQRFNVEGDPNCWAIIDGIIDWGQYIGVPCGFPGNPQVVHFRTQDEYNRAAQANGPLGEYHVNFGYTYMGRVPYPLTNFGDFPRWGRGSLGAMGVSTLKAGPEVQEISINETDSSGNTSSYYYPTTWIQPGSTLGLYTRQGGFQAGTVPISKTGLQPYSWAVIVQGSSSHHVWQDSAGNIVSDLVEGTKVLGNLGPIQYGIAQLTPGNVLRIDVVISNVHYQVSDPTPFTDPNAPVIVNGQYLSPLPSIGTEAKLESSKVDFW